MLRSLYTKPYQTLCQTNKQVKNHVITTRYSPGDIRLRLDRSDRMVNILSGAENILLHDLSRVGIPERCQF